jgi:HEAT repeat protein
MHAFHRLAFIRPFVPRSLLLAVACLGGAGCTSWPPPNPWSKTVTQADPYGMTADQRMAKLATEAKAARAGPLETHEAFTRQLVDTLLGEHDPRVRCGILDVASEFDTPSAVAICKGALQDPDERVRMAACSAWGRRGGPAAIDLLAARYQNDPELDVRLRAIRALGELRDAAAVPVLAKALEDGDPAVQYRAVAALKQASGRDLGNDVDRWREWAADPEGSGAEWSIAEGLRRLF